MGGGFRNRNIDNMYLAFIIIGGLIFTILLHVKSDHNPWTDE